MTTREFRALNEEIERLYPYVRDGIYTSAQVAEMLLPYIKDEALADKQQRYDEQKRQRKFEKGKAKIQRAFMGRVGRYSQNQRSWYNRYKANQIRWALNTARRYPKLIWDD